MSFDQFDTFGGVAQLQRVARGSAALRLAQPAVSAQLAARERSFNVKLLDRVGKEVLPTVAGARPEGECASGTGEAGHGSRAIGCPVHPREGSPRGLRFSPLSLRPTNRWPRQRRRQSEGHSA
jgi:hypothetical protein